MSQRTIDFSRYRLAEAIAERWRAGDTALDIGEDYFSFPVHETMNDDKFTAWVVELIVAATDRKGRFEPRGEPESEVEG